MNAFHAAAAAKWSVIFKRSSAESGASSGRVVHAFDISREMRGGVDRDLSFISYKL
jgi:hypothetical protein